MKKHAYLILCHGNYEILKMQLGVLDDERNDIYLHIDKKIKNFPFYEIKKIVKKAKLIFTKRISVTWGGYSLIRAELLLLRSAVKRNYVYYHLISGVDFPLKSQNFIHNFFDTNEGKEFIEHSLDQRQVKHRIKRIQNYYFFQDLLGRKESGTAWKLHRYSLKLQRRLGIDRIHGCPFEIGFGSNWFSITHNMANYLLSNKKLIRKWFSWGYAADELFLWSIANLSHYKDNIVNDNLRLIEWATGKPHVFVSCDYDRLIQSDKLFARKFDEDVDIQIVEKLYVMLKREENK